MYFINLDQKFLLLNIRVYFLVGNAMLMGIMFFFLGNLFIDKYRGIHEKGSGDDVSPVCYTTYIHTLSIQLSDSEQKQLKRLLSNPFREFLCMLNFMQEVLMFFLPNWFMVFRFGA